MSLNAPDVASNALGDPLVQGSALAFGYIALIDTYIDSVRARPECLVLA